MLAIAQTSPAVADAENFIELVRDENDGVAFAFQLRDDAEKIVDFMGGERRSRLIHDDDARAMRQHAGDRHQMFLCDAEALEQCVRVNPRLKPRQQRGGLRAHRPPVDKAARRQGRMTHENIFGDGKIVEHRRFLMDGGDAFFPGGAWAGEADRRAVERHLARVGAVDAGHDFDERRFARAVLADQAHDFASAQRQRHVVERAHAGEGFRNAGEGEEGRSCFGRFIDKCSGGHGALRSRVPLGRWRPLSRLRERDRVRANRSITGNDGPPSSGR